MNDSIPSYPLRMSPMSDATQREHDRIKTVARLLHEGCHPYGF